MVLGGALGTGFGKVPGRGFREPGFGNQVPEPRSGIGCWEPGISCFRPGVCRYELTVGDTT